MKAGCMVRAVHWSTNFGFNGTASGTGSWADGDADPKWIEFAIVDDGAGENQEFFELTLANPSGATLGTRSVLRVNIADGSGSIQAPNAIAGSSQNVTPGATVTLDGNQSNDPDGDPLTAVLVNGPAHGTLVLNPDGSFAYTPDAEFNGSDSFTVTITDDDGHTATQVISLSVTPVVDIVDDSLTTNEDSAISANVISGTNGASADSFEGTPVISGVTQGSNGTVTTDGTTKTDSYALYADANVKPAVVQNRFYQQTGYDADLRRWCSGHGVVYQSFWTLTANRHILACSTVQTIAQKYQKNIIVNRNANNGLLYLLQPSIFT